VGIADRITEIIKVPFDSLGLNEAIVVTDIVNDGWESGDALTLLDYAPPPEADERFSIFSFRELTVQSTKGSQLLSSNLSCLSIDINLRPHRFRPPLSIELKLIALLRNAVGEYGEDRVDCGGLEQFSQCCCIGE